jgi:hypothetical protein
VDMELISPAMTASTAPTSLSSSGIGSAVESAHQKEQRQAQSQNETKTPAPSNFPTAPDQVPNGTQPFGFPSSPRVGDPKTKFPIPSELVPVSGSVTLGAAEIAAPARSPQTSAAASGPSSHIEVEVDGRHTLYNTDPVSGRPNARATGSMFPAVLRHDADVSVSGLHIPGEFRE